METLGASQREESFKITNETKCLFDQKCSFKEEGESMKTCLLTIEENEYLNELNEKELKAYNIAKKYLGTSFDLKKSNGFLKWKMKNVKEE